MRKTVLAVASALSLAISIGNASLTIAETTMVPGEVKKIDTGAGKVTLKHGPIPNLDMDAMTMVFRVKEPTMLEGLKVGDKIKFAAERVNGAITITQISK